ncbi:MAG: HAMP domain-containing histidine kinase [Thermosediminibacteraceae bacterium]|nr:HAMP domain-containing histidine kinase [Thermosediminibacteraceae bacterium]
MRWKISLGFLLTYAVTTVIIFLLVLYFVSYYLLGSGPAAKENGPFTFPDQAEKFTLDFKKYIFYKDGKPAVTHEGLSELQKLGGWIQILDETGNEVYSRFKPPEAPSHYTPVDIVHAYKYSGVIGDYNIFISVSKAGGREWSYVIGFPYKYVSRFVFYLNISRLFSSWRRVMLSVFLSTALVTILISYLFGRKLAAPLFKIMDGIKTLSEGEYGKLYPEKGLYKEVYRQLNALSRTLEEGELQKRKLDRLREEWIENISHDLKTPLTSIKGYAEILLEDSYHKTPEEKNRYLKVIKEKADYIEQLLEDLRLTYRLKNDMVPLKLERVNLVDEVAEIIIDILNDPEFEGRKVDFQCEPKYIELCIDRHLFSRAVGNIIYNGLVHNPPETIIWVSLKKEAGAVVLEVKDNGRGIPPEELENLFERYYRGTGTGENPRGSGLGMAIAKQIVEAHKGRIMAESEPGKGTTVTMVFKP